VVLSRDHVKPFKHNFEKKRHLLDGSHFASSQNPYYFHTPGMGISSAAVCLIKFFMVLEKYEGGKSKRNSYSSQMKWNILDRSHFHVLFFPHNPGGGSKLWPPTFSDASCCHTCKISVYAFPIKIIHSFRRLGMPCTVVLTCVFREATPNDERVSLLIKFGHPRRTQTDCEVRYGQQ
jgi:hypothetical protein